MLYSMTYENINHDVKKLGRHSLAKKHKKDVETKTETAKPAEKQEKKDQQNKY